LSNAVEHKKYPVAKVEDNKVGEVGQKKKA
jgi:hypothetical protein